MTASHLPRRRRRRWGQIWPFGRGREGGRFGSRRRLLCSVREQGSVAALRPCHTESSRRREARPRCRGSARPSVSGRLPLVGHDRASAEKGVSGSGWSGRDCRVKDDLLRSFIRPQRNGGGHDHLAVAGGFRECQGEEGLGDAFRRRQAARGLAGKGAGAQRVRTMPGSSKLARTRVLAISPA
jgi:hypothetical protein